MHKIAPSILAADFANLQAEVEMLNNSMADWLHLDIMDGRFVPNISFGLPVVEAIKAHAEKHIDCHLMIVEPEKYLEDFKQAGADSISVHFEACHHLDRTVHQIKELECQAGVVLNPHTPVEALIDVIEILDYVVIMSVNPGFGGQTFIENTYSKITRLKRLASDSNPSVDIQIDGGVSDANASKLIAEGATNLVAGSAVFKAKDPAEMIQRLKSINS